MIKHPDFALPGRRALLKSDAEYEVVLIDATETPIERPKKRSKKNPLTAEDKKSNRQLSSGRILNENLIVI